MKLPITFKARYHNGVIEPLEPLSMEEGKEVTLTVIESPSRRKIHVSKRVIHLGGLWKDVAFDVSPEDIRQVRRKLSKSVQRRAKRV